MNQSESEIAPLFNRLYKELRDNTSIDSADIIIQPHTDPQEMRVLFDALHDSLDASKEDKKRSLINSENRRIATNQGIEAQAKRTARIIKHKETERKKRLAAARRKRQQILDLQKLFLYPQTSQRVLALLIDLAFEFQVGLVLAGIPLLTLYREYSWPALNEFSISAELQSLALGCVIATIPIAIFFYQLLFLIRWDQTPGMRISKLAFLTHDFKTPRSSHYFVRAAIEPFSLLFLGWLLRTIGKPTLSDLLAQLQLTDCPTLDEQEGE